MKHLGRILFLAYLALVTWVVVLALHADGWNATTAPAPAPSRVRWEQHDVGGYLLVRPTPDSTGNFPRAILPPGSVLAIPHVDREAPGHQPREGT